MSNNFELITHGKNYLNWNLGSSSLDFFASNFNSGADEIECDLALSKDNIICLYHDKDINIGTFTKVDFSNFNLTEIKQVNPRILTLDELITSFKKKNFILELKNYTNYRVIIEQVNSKYYDCLENIKFVSFSQDALINVKKINPNIYCAYIATNFNNIFVGESDIEVCLKNRFQEICGLWITFWPKMIRLARLKKLKVGLGIVNSSLSIRYCLNNYADRIYSDNIEGVVEIINKK